MSASDNFQYTFTLYQQGIKKLAKEIKASGIKFDYMLGVARGGAIPAVHLSNLLEIPIELIHWSSFSNPRMLVPDNHADPQVLEDLLDQKKILLVDDIVDNGRTVSELTKEWTSHRFFEFQAIKNMKVASLIYKRDNKNRAKADFYHIEHPGKFVDFWWEK